VKADAEGRVHKFFCPDNEARASFFWVQHPTGRAAFSDPARKKKRAAKLGSPLHISIKALLFFWNLRAYGKADHPVNI